MRFAIITLLIVSLVGCVYPLLTKASELDMRVVGAEESSPLWPSYEYKPSCSNSL